MILCGNTTEGTGEWPGAGVDPPPPPPDRKQAECREGQTGLRRVLYYVTINDGA